jgi:response regulator NasT
MRIVIVEDEPVMRMDMKCLIEDAGHEVVGEGKDGLDAISLCKETKPDLVVMDINMPNLDGISAARMIHRDKLCSAVVMLTAYSDLEYVQGAKEAGVYGYLIKPIDAKNLVVTLEIAYAKSLKTDEIEQNLSTVTQKLEDRKVIEKAKGYLMKKEGIDEDTAFKRIRTLSMEKGASLRSISEALLMTADIGKVDHK